ncbi:hypothetical protein HHK36_001945 [Tetracentron sinense]|uniref:PORR domain-containing protein n=1 Tax=Tetracentron sinense TaxID=13715 RepID=A0A834ZYY7_TETSI|nr:hypothetical protein HHK36_001945 [Tetracentron sinense]
MKIEEQAMSLSPFAFTACELLDVMMSVASEVKSMLDDAKSKPENERFLSLEQLDSYRGSHNIQALMKTNARKMAEQDELMDMASDSLNIIGACLLQNTLDGKQGFSFIASDTPYVIRARLLQNTPDGKQGEVLYSSLLSCVTMALGSLFTSHKIRTLEVFRVAIGQSKVSYYPLPNDTIAFGPFNKNTQKRWKKPVVSAQTRLEDRTRDLKIDKLMNELKRLRIVLKLHELMSNRRGPYVSMQLLSRWKNVIGLNIGIGVFLRKYPHIFEIFTHPVKKNLCCKITKKMVDLIEEEDKVIKESEIVAVQRLKKLLMVSTNGILHIHALRLIRRELGLPEDFRESILLKYSSDFKLVDLENVALVSRDESLAVADVEKWREKEYREKWLSEFETRYAFQIHFPTGFKIEKGFREKLKNWQRLPYLKPYERKEVVRVRTCGGVERFEKRVVSILHEFLSLTVEKMVEIERLSHFRKDFSMEINVLELLLKHPGIFYISTKGSTQTVFLREAYNQGSLIEPNHIYMVRRKMLHLVLLGCRNSRELQPQKDIKESRNNIVCNEVRGGPRAGDWVIPILESFDEQNPDDNHSEISVSSEEEINEYYDNGCGQHDT